MPLPLYQGLHAPQRLERGTMHLGLWFERFYSGYEADFNKVDEIARSEWLHQFTRVIAGDSRQLTTKANAIAQLATSHGGDTRIYHCPGNFVTGLGNPHPLENGFLWHHTLGLPYLPGSAVKGLVRALVETAYKGEDRDAVLKRWFGTVTKEPDEVPEQSGQFIFLDALPVTPCELLPEVMTPHMGKWYEKGGKPPPPPPPPPPQATDTQPGDWHSPVPVGYLVARDLRLQFGIIPRASVANHPGIQDELANVWCALDKALDWLGAGAKTAIGFGQFQRDQTHEEKLKKGAEAARQEQIKKTEIEKATLIERAILELQDKLQPLKNIGAGDNRLAQFWTHLDALIQEWTATGNPEERQKLHEAIRSGIKSQKLPISKGRKTTQDALLNQLLQGM